VVEAGAWSPVVEAGAWSPVVEAGAESPVVEAGAELPSIVNLKAAIRMTASPSEPQKTTLPRLIFAFFLEIWAVSDARASTISQFAFCGALTFISEKSPIPQSSPCNPAPHSTQGSHPSFRSSGLSLSFPHHSVGASTGPVSGHLNPARPVMSAAQERRR
jgi:hypothetical protein